MWISSFIGGNIAICGRLLFWWAAASHHRILRALGPSHTLTWKCIHGVFIQMYFSSQVVLSCPRAISPLMINHKRDRIDTAAIVLDNVHCNPRYLMGIYIHQFLHIMFRVYNAITPICTRQTSSEIHCQICTTYVAVWCLTKPAGESGAISLMYFCTGLVAVLVQAWLLGTLIARFIGPTWGPPGADRTQVDPMLAPWTLLSGDIRPVSTQYKIYKIYATSPDYCSGWPTINRRPIY